MSRRRKYYKGDIIKVVYDSNPERVGQKYYVETFASRKLQLLGGMSVYYADVVLYKRPFLNKCVNVLAHILR